MWRTCDGYSLSGTVKCLEFWMFTTINLQESLDEIHISHCKQMTLIYLFILLHIVAFRAAEVVAVEEVGQSLQS